VFWGREVGRAGTKKGCANGDFGALLVDCEGFGMGIFRGCGGGSLSGGGDGLEGVLDGWEWEVLL